ncbi:MAG: hypothetical protein RLZZ299_923 [Pseudomonadota bacterium]|jgi:23S rRNA G2069 N7-methylase RlmK/C1962 C5-methylase RlmI
MSARDPHRYDAATIDRHAEMIANRVRKAFAGIGARMRRDGVGAWRAYDRDIPEVRCIVDVYEGARFGGGVAEGGGPPSAPRTEAQGHERHLVLSEHVRTQTEGTPYLEVLSRALADAAGVSPERVHHRLRRTRPAEGDRYAQLGARSLRLVVEEPPFRFVVNLTDYVDTGLFVDMRPLRARIWQEASGRTLLNLFGYTGAFTVAAAVGGARGTTTVDASGNWLRVAEENLRLNGVAEVGDGRAARHRLVRADARAWLLDAQAAGAAWDTVVLDPPSFSDHGGQSLDLQRDHRFFVRAALGVTKPGGTLWFATNHQRFAPDLGGLHEASSVVECTEETLPPDVRNRAAHRAWRIVKG